MKKFNGNVGITLIALVITIIVLLILAGVSIAMLTGENGILNQVQKAKSETEIAKAEEIANLGLMAARIEEYQAGEEIAPLTVAIEELTKNNYTIKTGAKSIITINDINLIENSAIVNEINIFEGYEKNLKVSIVESQNTVNYVQINDVYYEIVYNETTKLIEIKSEGVNDAEDTEVKVAITPTSELAGKIKINEAEVTSNPTGIEVTNNQEIKVEGVTIGTGKLVITLGTESKEINVNVTEEQDVIANLEDVVKQGDYVTYTVPNNTFTMYESETNVPDQTFNTAEYKGAWVVNEVYDDYIEIISENDVTNGQYLELLGDENSDDFSGLLAWIEVYNNLEKVLNDFCKNYVNENVADWGRAPGTNPRDAFNYTSKQYFDMPEQFNGTQYEYLDIVERVDTYNYYNTIHGVWTNERYYSGGGCGENSILFYAEGSGLNIRPDHSWAWGSIQPMTPIIKLKNGLQKIRGNGTKEHPYVLVTN